MSNNNHLYGISVDFGMPEIPFAERVAAISDVGFDAIFTGWSARGCLADKAKIISSNKLIYQSVHAPFNKSNLMWKDGDDGDALLEMLSDCVRDAAENGVPIVVCHAWIGFDLPCPNEIGVRRFAALAELAERLGVKLALENTEGEPYLDKLLTELSDYPSVGFCIDTGHELCYNESRDLICRYGGGGKLFATHLNDNMGITGDKITWKDDSHLLPFDGVADWQGVAKRLKKVDFNEILTFELTTKSKPERNTHEIYDALDYHGFVSLAYERALKIGELLDNE